MKYLKKRLRSLFVIYSIICFIIIFLVFQFILEPIHENVLFDSLETKSNAIALIESHNLKHTTESIFPLKKDFINSANFIGTYDKQLKLKSKVGIKLKKDIFHTQYNTYCGIKSLKETLIPCSSNINSILYTYTPIIHKGLFAGFVYMEIDKYQFGVGLFNKISIFICFSILLLLILGLKLISYIVYWVNSSSNAFRLLSEEKTSCNSKLPEWVVHLMQPTIELKSRLRQDISFMYAKIEDKDQELSDLTKKLNVVEQKAINAIDNKTKKLAQASHDIRSPLHTILATCEIAKEETKDNNLLLKLSSIYDAGCDLKREVDNILIYEANELDRVETTLERIDIEKEVDSIIQQVGLQYSSDKPVHAYSIIERDVPRYIASYKFALIKILTNLGSNARKFTSDGHVVIKVSFQPRSESNGKLIILIEDTGRGMCKEQVESFGKHFKQYHKDSSSKGGVGLGLQIVQQYKEQINAQISLNSVEGKGTTFRLTVDVENELATSSSQHGSVLIIDPNPETLFSLTEKFYRRGFQINNVSAICEIDHSKIPSVDFLAINITDTNEYTAFKDFYNHQELSIKGGVVFSYLPEVKADKKLRKKFVVTSIHTPFQQVLSSIIQLRNDRCDKQDSHSLINPIHIMSVDNEEINLKIIERFLKAYPITITSFTNPILAIKSAQTQIYDLILMDIFMPEIKGYEASAQIREKGVNKTTPIIAATATVSTSERECIFKSGMTDILIKPFNKDLLISIIQKYNRTNELSINTSDVQNININSTIMKSIVNMRGFGDIDSELLKIIELEKLTTILFYANHLGCADKFSDLFLELKTAFYYKSAPLNTCFSQIDKLLQEIEQHISASKGSIHAKA